MGSSLKILAVDDEPSIVQSMFFIFEQPMYEVDSAEDGEAALARVAANPNPFDVVITDNNMPGVSGIELVRQLRERNFSGQDHGPLGASLGGCARGLRGDESRRHDREAFSVKALRHALDELAA
jgi:CheY-like chemotaxis protein